jgi:aminopeptidase
LETAAVGAALAGAARDARALVELVELEKYGPRPLEAVPDGLAADLKAFNPTATIFAAQGQPGEIRFRIPLGAMLRKEFAVRHGHMIGITPQLMAGGMTADYAEVAEVTRKVNARVEYARRIKVTGPGGTGLDVSLDPDNLHWQPCPGLYREPGQWGNLPEGETFTSPASVEGTLAASVLGDYFSARYGLLAEPVVFTIADSRVSEVTHPSAELAEDVWGYLSSSPNGTRVGEFAIGTNVFLTELTGNLLQDEKFPGVHVAFGNPYPDVTGATWSSDIHVDVIPLGVSIEVDGEPLMEDGRFLL